MGNLKRKSAPKNNNYAEKWKTSEERKTVHKKLCAHLKKGLSWGCFPLAYRETIDKYIEKYPTDFLIDEIQEAEKEGLMKLEQAGVDAALGTGRKIDTKAWQFIMMNRAKWSLSNKQDHTSNGETLGVVQLPTRNENTLEADKETRGSSKKE